MTTTTSWTDTPDTFCDCEIDECEKLHPATEILPDRFAFWVIDDKQDSYYAAGMIADFVIEVRDLFDGDKAIVKDLATGETMDAAEFLAARP